MAQPALRTPRPQHRRPCAAVTALALAGALLACDLCAEPIVPTESGPLLVSVGLRVGECPLHPDVPYVPGSPDLQPAGRAWHLAVLLQDGRVLVVGGRGYGSPEPFPRSSAQLWDPATGRWRLTAPPPGNSLEAALVLGGDGRVLFLGWQYVFFDPRTETWSVGGQMPEPLAAPRAVELASGLVLVTGDRWMGNDTTAWAGLYDPAADAWQAIAAPEGPRFGATLTLLRDGGALLAGGERYEATAAADRFDPATATWRPTAPMAAARRPPFACLLPSGHVLVAGWPAEVYDPEGETWAPTPNRTFVSASRAALLGDGSILLAEWDVGLYDPAADVVRVLRPEYRSGHSVTALPDGRALVVGGDARTDGWDPVLYSLPTAELYDPATGGWTRVGDLLPDPPPASGVF